MNLIEKIIEEKISRYSILSLSLISIFSIFVVGGLKALLLSRTKIPFDVPTILKGILFLLIWVLALLFFLWFWELIKEKILWPIHLRFKNKLISIPIISGWIFQGSLKITGNYLETTASNSGCLIKKYRYKNFLLSFNVKILNGGRFGVIFRAQDLENYLMLEIALEDGFKFSDGHIGTRVYEIVPWIRFLGNWEIFNITSEPFHPTEIEFDSAKGLLINLEVKDLVANFAIESNKKIEKFCWDIPTNTESNIPLLSKGVPIAVCQKKDFQRPADGKFVQKIWFKNKYGRIGFRAHAWQIVRISDLKIEKI